MSRAKVPVISTDEAKLAAEAEVKQFLRKVQGPSCITFKGRFWPLGAYFSPVSLLIVLAMIASIAIEV